MLPISVEKRISSIAVLIGPLVTLAITPFWNYDPINLGKVLVLTTFSFSCLGLLAPYCVRIYRENKLLCLIVFSFFVLMLSSFFFSGANKSQQFWGIWGRSTGILTYCGLLVTTLVIAVIQKRFFYVRLMSFLFLTTFLVGTYALVQLFGRDPIEWSAYAAFGTLGNVNFLSGFMGIATSAMLVVSLSTGTSNRTRILLIFAMLTGLAIVYQTDSIQGLVAFAAGSTLFMLIETFKRGIKFFIPAIIVSCAGFSMLVIALFNKGPLASLIYQVTIVFRADYMHAGLKMLLHNPIFGVGIDSYDDWYRTERGIVSAFRTSFNRTANSAHNVTLDVASGGGLPLLIAYLALIILVLVSILKGFKSGLLSDPIFLSAVCAWFAYQVQASVSINQIGVGVWGWIISGLIIGLTRIKHEEQSSKVLTYDFLNSLRSKNNYSNLKKTQVPNSPPPITVITSLLLTSVGFILAFIPLRLDMQFRSAINSGDLVRMIDVVRSPASQAFQISQVANLALANNFPEQGREMTNLLLNRYPRNYFGWATTLDSPAFSVDRKQEAQRNLRLIDPNEALCLNDDPARSLIEALRSLPVAQQKEILVGWGLADDLSVSGFASLIGPSGGEVEKRILAFCG